MSEYIDEATNTRPGEELDPGRVEAFLKDSIAGLSGEFRISQFPSGFSNLTYFIKFGTRELVLRRPPFGRKAKTAHDMGREFRMLSALKPVFPYCPAPLAYSEDEGIMGCPFYVMERIKGIILRKNLPKGLSLSPPEMRALCKELADVQIALHKVDYRAAGLADYGKPEGYVERQVTGWSRRYRDARTPDAPDFETVMSWLAEKMPADSPYVAVIHNDYKFDNVVLDPANPLKIIGVLDWEMATIGDPLMDLGSSIAYWVEKTDPANFQAVRMLPTHLDGAMTRDELVEYYSRHSGIPVDNFDYYFCFGLFRLAVIAQQIYYRFYHGQTKDQRFAMLIFAVKILEETALKVLEKSVF
ncbi:MAG: phosphotransferase family protein [Spirochaetes bacterium]|nr:MAG: phosphotransferase family protein [Spirochaetota bacterium]